MFYNSIRAFVSTLCCLLILTAVAKASDGFGEVTVFYATDRATQNEDGASEPFSADQSGEIQFGRFSVTIPTKRGFGEVPSPSFWQAELRADPEKHVIVTGIEYADQGQFIREVAEETKSAERSEVFLYVPGYNTTAENAARRAATLAVDMNISGVVVVYSWPSRGQILAYARDETMVQRSAPYFLEVLELFREEIKVDQFELLAFGMGNRLLLSGLHVFSQTMEVDTPVFDDVIFLQPDVDTEIFEQHYLNGAHRTTKNAAILYSPNDPAIEMSRRLRADLDRGSYSELDIEGLDFFLLPEQSSDLLGLAHAPLSGTAYYLMLLRRSRLLLERGFVEKAIGQTQATLTRFNQALGADHYLTHLALEQYVHYFQRYENEAADNTFLDASEVSNMLDKAVSETLKSLDGGTAQIDADAPTNALTAARRLIGIFLEGQRLFSENVELIDGGFELSQYLKKSSAAESLKAAVARLGFADSRIDDLIRESDAVTENLQDQEAVLAVEKARQKSERDPRRESRLEQKRDEYRTRLVEINQELETIDAKLPELSNTRSMSVEEARSYLSEDEALVYYFFIDKDQLVAYVVGPSGVNLVRIDVSTQDLSRIVSSLRHQLDIRGAEFASQLPLYDVTQSHALYKKVFEPLEKSLLGVNRILVVTSGPLDSLPFHTLVSQVASERNGDWPELYSGSTWLSDRFSIAHLPTATSLRFLKSDTSGADSKPYPLLGFGDPTMHARFQSNTSTNGNEPQIVSTVEDQFQTKLITLGGRGNFDGLAPIPQTRELLLAVGKSVNARDRDLYFGDDAMEEELVAFNYIGRLRQYQYLMFATHALVAGELKNYDLVEPAIVLSSGNQSEAKFSNDGLLRASEVVGLKLDADMVLLVACNTAASDGRPGAEPLSGLARSFFYAGARSLLVSHWPAEASASTALISAMVENMNDGMKRSDALRAAMTEVRNDPDNPHFSHPALWGAFVVIGAD